MGSTRVADVSARTVSISAQLRLLEALRCEQSPRYQRLTLEHGALLTTQTFWGAAAPRAKVAPARRRGEA